MANRILVESRPAETRVALIEDDKLAELNIERAGDDALNGNIYLGRVENILPGMQSAFVNIGMEKNAFLFAGDFQMDKTDFGDDARALKAQLDALSIKKLLKVGQEILVQINKVSGGGKGPRISSHITLPGRLVVLLPNVAYVGVSRRINDEAERERLRALARDICPDNMGLIARTAAEGADERALKADIERLTLYYETLMRRAKVIKAPALMHRDHDIIYRAIRDVLSDDIDEIRFDGADAYSRAQEYARLLAPEHIDKLVMDAGETKLFERFNIPKQIERALSRRVWLKSGGYLVFDRTEALTVIDVNTGKYVGKNSLSDTVFKINMEAVSEIARQLRLRDIGGIIVIDFIDMDTPEQKQELLSTLKKALKSDRTHTNVLGLTALGLIEMTRKKKREPLQDILTRACAHCSGSGIQLTPETIAHDILDALNRRLMLNPSQPLTARVSASVYEALTQIDCALAGRAYAVREAWREDTQYTIDLTDAGEPSPDIVPIARNVHE